MTSKSMRRLQVGLAVGLAVLLSACGGGGGSGKREITPPKVVTTSQEDKFGTAFGTDFRASANSEPAVVSDTDIVPVDLTTAPIDITC